jgi:hypothetical protein
MVGYINRMDITTARGRTHKRTVLTKYTKKTFGALPLYMYCR